MDLIKLNQVCSFWTDEVFCFAVLQRLKALDDGWNDLRKMCDNKQNMLQQNLNLQIFLRDCKQAEILLSEQDNFLSKEDIPVTHYSGLPYLVTVYCAVDWADY